jgi:hypothetical protein
MRPDTRPQRPLRVTSAATHEQDGDVHLSAQFVRRSQDFSDFRRADFWALRLVYSHNQVPVRSVVVGMPTLTGSHLSVRTAQLTVMPHGHLEDAHQQEKDNLLLGEMLTDEGMWRAMARVAVREQQRAHRLALQELHSMGARSDIFSDLAYKRRVRLPEQLAFEHQRLQILAHPHFVVVRLALDLLQAYAHDRARDIPGTQDLIHAASCAVD